MNNSSAFDLYLASASPRRRELLNNMGLSVKVCPADIDETPLLDELPTEYVRRLSLDKAQVVYDRCIERRPDKPFMGSDTIVVCRGEMMGKPTDRGDAVRMWKMMSGGSHQVLTAVSLVSENKKLTITSVSEVTFCDISEEEMDVYWQSGEPKDKAGAYAIQGLAAAWVVSIEGSYTGIMGLPLYETNQALKTFGLHWM